MNYKFENNLLTIYLEGRVDTSNADAREKEILEIRNSNPDGNVVLDVENLDYISSAGLRVVLRFRKANASLRIINASSEIYDIFEMTGFTEMIPVEKAYRKLSVDGCEIIGQGAKGTVYRYSPDIVVKVYKNPDSLPDIINERSLARKAFVLGIPTAIPYDVVRVGNSYGSVFELLEAKSFSKLIRANPENMSEYAKIFADMLQQIHHTNVNADDMPDVKIRINHWLEDIKPEFDDSSNAKMKQLVDDVPNTLNMLHCDYHTNNIMMQNGETLLIDMDTLSHGHPIFELANIYITYVGFGEIDPTVVEKFLNLPYDTSIKFWDVFLPFYLGTDNPEEIEKANNKVKLLSYIRLMRHTLRRGLGNEGDGAKTVELCKGKILELLEKVDTLSL